MQKPLDSVEWMDCTPLRWLATCQMPFVWYWVDGWQSTAAA